MKILHMFRWNVKDITKELVNIKNQGFDAIQITPIQPTKNDSSAEWWMVYQPIGFRIGNRYGSKEDLIKLCEEAKEYNIKIIADIVLNHVAGKDDGSIEPHENTDKCLLNNKFFWKNNIRIQDWNNRIEVINNSLGLPSLRLDNYDLQDIIIRFLNELIDCGVRGFRFDAAKNIGLPEENKNHFWIRVLNSLNKKEELSNYAEVIFESKEIIDQYCKYINVLTNGCGSDYNRNKLVTFVESHDTYLEFQYTKYMSDKMIINEYNHLRNNFKNTIFYCRPFNNLWKSDSIRNINYLS